MAQGLSPEDPRIHELVVRLRHAVNTIPAEEVFSPPESKQSLLDEVDKVLSKDMDLMKYNDEFLEKNKGSTAYTRSGNISLSHHLVLLYIDY
jgi:hypothetical protein